MDWTCPINRIHWPEKGSACPYDWCLLLCAFGKLTCIASCGSKQDWKLRSHYARNHIRPQNSYLAITRLSAPHEAEMACKSIQKGKGKGSRIFPQLRSSKSVASTIVYPGKPVPGLKLMASKAIIGGVARIPISAPLMTRMRYSACHPPRSMRTQRIVDSMHIAQRVERHSHVDRCSWRCLT